MRPTLTVVLLARLTTAAIQYTNPVLALDCPDPAVLRGLDRLFYVYCTEGNGLMFQVSRSTDLVAWEIPKEAMPTRPSWMPQSGGSNFWAPHVRIASDGAYVMYFAGALASNGSMCIGAAISKQPMGPFVDAGKPVACGDGFTTIDPMLFSAPDGNLYLYWGSSGVPIHVQQLSSDGLQLAPGSQPSYVLTPNQPVKAPYEGLLEGPWLTADANGWFVLHGGTTSLAWVCVYSRIACPEKEHTNSRRRYLRCSIGLDISHTTHLTRAI